MYYLLHLALPFIAAVGFAVRGVVVFGQSLAALPGEIGEWYIILALPHWVWAGVSAYFETSKTISVGGFIGAHAMLVLIGAIYLTAHGSEAVNVWMLYILASPVTIMAGALIGNLVRRGAQK